MLLDGKEEEEKKKEKRNSIRWSETITKKSAVKKKTRSSGVHPFDWGHNWGSRLDSREEVVAEQKPEMEVVVVEHKPETEDVVAGQKPETEAVTGQKPEIEQA